MNPIHKASSITTTYHWGKLTKREREIAHMDVVRVLRLPNEDQKVMGSTLCSTVAFKELRDMCEVIYK